MTGKICIENKKNIRKILDRENQIINMQDRLITITEKLEKRIVKLEEKTR